MSLFEEMLEPFVFMDKTRVADGAGGSHVQWQEGAEIQADAHYDSSMQAQIAEGQGVTSVYKIYTHTGVHLEYHDVLKRVRDGKIFRITSDASERTTPKSANIDISVVNAEKWELTT